MGAFQYNNGAFCYTDTRTTQWEDPRLQNSAITGPVSIICVGERLTKLSSILCSSLKVSIYYINYYKWCTIKINPVLD